MVRRGIIVKHDIGLARPAGLGVDVLIDQPGGSAMSFGLYLVGFLIMIGGLIYGATILHVAPQWIAVGAIILVGLAILKGVQTTRLKDPS